MLLATLVSARRTPSLLFIRSCLTLSRLLFVAEERVDAFSCLLKSFLRLPTCQFDLVG